MTETEQASQAFMHAADRVTTLYALSGEYTRLVDLLEDPEADPALVEQELDRIGGAIAQKAEAIAGLIKWYEGLANMREAEAKRMAETVGTFKRQAERLRAYVLVNMRATGLERVDTARFTVSVRQNPARVEILEEMMVPGEFKEIRTTVHIDKRAILAHTKQTGEVVPGTEVVRGERLDIR